MMMIMVTVMMLCVHFGSVQFTKTNRSILRVSFSLAFWLLFGVQIKL